MVAIGYKRAIALIATRQMKADMFERSFILSIVYDKPKEKVMNDLVEARGHFQRTKLPR